MGVSGPTSSDQAVSCKFQHWGNDVVRWLGWAVLGRELELPVALALALAPTPPSDHLKLELMEPYYPWRTVGIFSSLCSPLNHAIPFRTQCDGDRM